MTKTTSARPEVIDVYVAELDRELRKLPRTQAQVLRMELLEHLDEILLPGATNLAAGKVVRELGSPAELVAEALDGARPRPRWRRVRRGTWVALGTAVAVAAAGVVTAATLIPRYADARLHCVCAITMYTKGAVAEPTVSRVGGLTQWQVPVFAFHRAGWSFAVVNNTGVTQTILGPASDSVGFFESGPAKTGFDVSTENTLDSASPTLHFSSGPAVLAPHTARVIRVNDREPCAVAGSVTSLDSFGIRVRVGMFTHTDEIALSPVVAFKRALTPGCPRNGIGG